jgi:glycosyltransferase involved in cell wall biosynthesis
MRAILHVIYSLYRGGAERQIETIVHLSKGERYRHLVCSLTSGGDLIETIEEAGGKVFLLGKRHRGDVSTFWKLARLIRGQRADLIHLHGAAGAFWGTLAAALGGIRVPIVRTAHRPYLPALLPDLYRRLYPYLLKRARRVICVSESVRKSYAMRFPDLGPRIVTIPNGIRTAEFENLPTKSECRSRFGLPESGVIIGTIGRLVPVKNHALLIDMLPRLREDVPGSHIAILGEGELEQSLRARIDELGLHESVSIIGPTSDVPLFLGSLDLFVLSSDSEGLPLTILEAQAAGLSVVATSVGGIPEVITDGENGYTVPPGSSTQLLTRTSQLLHDPEEADLMGDRGRKKVRELYGAQNMVDGVESVYDEVFRAAHL